MAGFSKTIQLLILFTLCISCKNSADNTQDLPTNNPSDSKHFEFTNELANETSPYLLQHAHNPVDWVAWGDNAFELAKKKNKLVILSIGYSSCHWCHVMEEESFEDKDVAKLMNDGYVNIKVDREERPDIDMVYQTALELVQGSGGWPLNAILLPNGKPVYVGTYHEKEHWKTIVAKFKSEHENNPEKMEEYASLLTKGMQEVYATTENDDQVAISTDQINESILKWSAGWDNEWGGDTGTQKFILPPQLNLLLDYSMLTNDSKAKNHLKNTLDKILLGGIQDHLEGGFFRYSTDPQWKVPHFEKMLYDNAQIIGLYSKAYRVFKDPNYKKAVEMTLDFLEKEMKGANGGYLSAIDADSNGKEGAFYVWGIDELKSKLREDFPLFSELYTIKKEEVWEDGKYVLFKKMTNAEFAKSHSLSLAELDTKIAEWQQLLLKERMGRVHPKKDDKIITSWNALMVEGLVESYMAFGREEQLTEAKNTFDFLLGHNYKDKNLVHTYKEGSRQKEVFIEDYAFMVQGALALYKVTLDQKYLNIAQELNKTALENYSDSSGLFAFSATDKLITKIIKTADGVMPSANAIMAHNLMELGHIEYNTSFLKKSKAMVSIVTNEFKEHPQSYSQWGISMLNQTYPYFEIVVVGSNAFSLVKELNEIYLPNALVVGSKEENETSLFKDRFFADGTYIYVCQNSTCKLPVKTKDEAIAQLRSFGHKSGVLQ